MKNNTFSILKSIFVLTLMSLFLNSCYNASVVSNNSIQKRKYLKGFYVKNNSHQKADKNELASDKSVKHNLEKSEAIAYSNSNNNNNAVDYSNPQNDIASISDEYSDILEPHTQKPNELIVSKSHNNINISNKSTITKKSQNNIEKTEITKETIASQNTTTINDTENTSGGKSQLVALLLVIFVGVIGVHRFYLGYVGLGILELLTGGVCGILTLIDLIRIATGDLKPKNGEYSKTL